MKRYAFLTICLLALAFQGCQEENPGSGWTPNLAARYLQLGTNTLSFGASSNLTQGLKVSATTTSWQFTGMDSWLTLSPVSGSETVTVQATATENLSADNSRTCILTFASTASDYPYATSVQATQTYAEPYIRLSESSLSFDGKASSAKVNVTANNAWTVSSSESWLTVETASDASFITVKVTENTTNSSRQATVTLKGKITATLTVVQAIAKIEGDQATLTYKQSGGTYQLSISSEASWTASTEQTWIQIDPAKGTAGTTQVLVSATPNESVKERKGWITFYIGGAKKIEVAVVQKGQYLEADCETLSFEAAQSTKQLKISSNISWSLQSKPSWITLNETSGTGDKALQVTASDNPELKSRSGSLIFGTTGGTVSDTVNVYQEAKRFNPEAFSVLHFSDKAGTDTLKFETDAAWTAKSNDDWITVEPVKGSGDGRIAVTVTENISDDGRTGSISVTIGETVKTAAVQQDGKYFTVTTGGQATIPSTGGTHQVSFQTNDTWRVTTGSLWISADPTQGSGHATVTFGAGDYPSIYPRTDTSYINPTNTQGFRVITTQAARYLRVDHTRLNFFAKGGASDKVVVETDATYTITTGTQWLTIQQDGNTFTATAESYTGSTQREGIITLVMTGLMTDQSYKIDLPVTQYAEGAHFTVENYSADENWNIASESSATITVVGFGDEEDWTLGVIDGHEYVDLGLPSGTLWATCNVGASKPEEYGDYFSWGETTGYNSGKTNFEWSTYKWCNGLKTGLMKYCTDSTYGIVDNKTELELADDAANANWGGNWRMPSVAQFDELISECSSEWTTQNSVYGRIVTSKKNGNSIFLPAAGCRDGASHRSVDSAGFYFLKSLSESISYDAYNLYFTSIEFGRYYDGDCRCYGFSIRPVVSK